MDNKDWRVTNQMNYLFKQNLIKGCFVPYREGWEHEHCAFCSEKIDANTPIAYSTVDRYHWICEQCFNDFKEMFEWEVFNAAKE